jgi:hypothetical protein
MKSEQLLYVKHIEKWCYFFKISFSLPNLILVHSQLKSSDYKSLEGFWGDLPTDIAISKLIASDYWFRYWKFLVFIKAGNIICLKFSFVFEGPLNEGFLFYSPSVSNFKTVSKESNLTESWRILVMMLPVNFRMFFIPQF